MMEEKREDAVGALPIVAMLVIFSVSLFGKCTLVNSEGHRLIIR
jgi:hypothetical protein